MLSLSADKGGDEGAGALEQGKTGQTPKSSAGTDAERPREVARAERTEPSGDWRRCGKESRAELGSAGAGADGPESELATHVIKWTRLPPPLCTCCFCVCRCPQSDSCGGVALVP